MHFFRPVLSTVGKICRMLNNLAMIGHADDTILPRNI